MSESFFELAKSFFELAKSFFELAKSFFELAKSFFVTGKEADRFERRASSEWHPVKFGSVIEVGAGGVLGECGDERWIHKLYGKRVNGLTEDPILR